MPDLAPHDDRPVKDSPVPVGDDAPRTGGPLSLLRNLRRRARLTPEQAETLAGIKFPCC